MVNGRFCVLGCPLWKSNKKGHCVKMESNFSHHSPHLSFNLDLLSMDYDQNTLTDQQPIYMYEMGKLKPLSTATILCILFTNWKFLHRHPVLFAQLDVLASAWRLAVIMACNMKVAGANILLISVGAKFFLAPTVILKRHQAPGHWRSAWRQAPTLKLVLKDPTQGGASRHQGKSVGATDLAGKSWRFQYGPSIRNWYWWNLGTIRMGVSSFSRKT